MPTILAKMDRQIEEAGDRRRQNHHWSAGRSGRRMFVGRQVVLRDGATDESLAGALNVAAGQHRNLLPALESEFARLERTDVVKSVPVERNAGPGVGDHDFELAQLVCHQAIGGPPLAVFQLAGKCQTSGVPIRRNGRPSDAGARRAWEERGSGHGPYLKPASIRMWVPVMALAALLARYSATSAMSRGSSNLPKAVPSR